MNGFNAVIALSIAYPDLVSHQIFTVLLCYLIRVPITQNSYNFCQYRLHIRPYPCFIVIELPEVLTCSLGALAAKH